MGDLKKDSFDTVWKNPVYQDFRTRVFTDRKSVDICTNCTEGMRV
jgi:hypothetical protein